MAFSSFQLDHITSRHFERHRHVSEVKDKTRDVSYR
ncbi:hypothetical protein T06_15272 [Trichinella sp. T6]|nr:hypothetical protein T06_15272 [Trichinella sp. T6]